MSAAPAMMNIFIGIEHRAVPVGTTTFFHRMTVVKHSIKSCENFCLTNLTLSVLDKHDVKKGTKFGLCKAFPHACLAPI